MSDRKTWQGRAAEVEVLYSYAGIATQILLRAQGEDLLLDCGDGTYRELTERRALESLAGVAFSHGHYDHVGGLWSLLGGLRCIGRTDDLPLVGPPGCVELDAIVDGFLDAYEATLPFTIRRIRLAPGEGVGVGPFRLTPFEVRHAGSIAGGALLPPIPALGWSVEVGGERVVYSGDTTETPELEAAVEGADLAILEATLETGTSRVHLSRDYAERVGRTAREHILVHGIHPAYR